MPSDEKVGFEKVDLAQFKGMGDADDPGKVGETNSSGGGSGSGTGSVATSQQQKKLANNVGNIRTNNERFLYMFKEGVKKFRIP